LDTFEPFFRHPHLTTLAGNFWKRSIDESRFPIQAKTYPTEPGTEVLVEETRPSGPVKGEVLLLHGLEGSSQSGYMISLAQALCERGYAAHRVNMRGCGGSEHLTASLYHSGLTADLRILLERIKEQGRGPRFLVGYSLGGNVSLKLAGELGPAGPELLQGVVAVSTPLDLAACVERLGARENWLYEQKFVRSLKARYRRRHQAFPDRFPLDGLEGTRTVFEFDDRFTSKAFGFGDAPNYYRTQSSIRFLGAIETPVLLIQAEDDPLIPFSIFESKEVRQNPHLRLLKTRHGGHLGYIARRQPRFWVDVEILRWLEITREQLPSITRPHKEER
jgi:predicted alpha/beta-fold hydrolase